MKKLTSLDSLLPSGSGKSFVCVCSLFASASDMLPVTQDVTEVTDDPVTPESPNEILGRGGTGGRVVPFRRPDVGK